MLLILYCSVKIIMEGPGKGDIEIIHEILESAQDPFGMLPFLQNSFYLLCLS